MKALELGADIVVTGRCVDSALVLAPAMHKLGWQLNQIDNMAIGRWTPWKEIYIFNRSFVVE